MKVSGVTGTATSQLNSLERPEEEDCHQPNLLAPVAPAGIDRVAVMGLLCIRAAKSLIHVSSALCSLPAALGVSQDLALCPQHSVPLYDDILQAGKSDFCPMLFFLAKVITCSMTLSCCECPGYLFCHSTNYRWAGGRQPPWGCEPWRPREAFGGSPIQTTRVLCGATRATWRWPHCTPHRELPRDAGVRVGGTSHGVNPHLGRLVLPGAFPVFPIMLLFWVSQ